MIKNLENIIDSDPKLQKAPVNYEGVSCNLWFKKNLNFEVLISQFTTCRHIFYFILYMLLNAHFQMLKISCQVFHMSRTSEIRRGYVNTQFHKSLHTSL